MQNLGSDDNAAGKDLPSYPPAQYPPQPPIYPPQSPTYPPQPPTYLPQPAAGYPSQSPATGGQPQAPITYQPQFQQPVYPASQMTNTNTTVIIQQQPAPVMEQQPQGWSTGLWDCCSDSEVCLMGCLCPWFLPAYVSCKAGECCCVGWLCPIALRAVIRERYNIRGSIAGDCCTIYCDYVNSMCQMARELKIRTGS